jgi:type 1 glutamine amidotransferase
MLGAAGVVALLVVPQSGTIAAQGRSGAPSQEPRVRALVVSGGCCHDYVHQGRILMEAVGKAMPVDWTLLVQGRGTTTRFSIYNRPDWIKDFDIVVHNECSADVTDEAFVRSITSAHRTSGVPALVIHCAMHTFRAATFDDWREFLGVTTRRHTAQHRISVKLSTPDDPITKGFKPDWVTPMDELYVIDKFWPNARAIATAVSPEDQKEYPLAWVNNYHGARVFGTTLGHGSDTWSDPVFQDLLVRGVSWALGKTK